MTKNGLSKICLFLLGMIFIQASYGQINKIASVPVSVERNIMTPNGTRDFSWMVEDWQKSKLYVSSFRDIQVIDPKNFSVENISLPRSPCGICVDKVTGRIATPNQKFNILGSEVSFVITDPETKMTQEVKVRSDGEVAPLWMNVCAFSTDGKTLYLGNMLEDFATSPKLIAVDTATWKIAWTWADVNLVSAIFPLPNGKVYFITKYPRPYTNPTWDLRVLDLDGMVKKVDLGGLMPKTLNLGPNGHLYMFLGNGNSGNSLELDPTTNEVLDSTNWLTSTFVSWPSNDSNYVYTSPSLGFVGLVNRTIVSYINGVTSYGMTAKRQTDGSDLIAVLSDNRVDFYKYTPDVPKGIITATSELYYGVKPVVSTRYAPADILTVWGEKLCPDFPIVLQVPPPIPLRKELAGCSVRIVDSKGNDLSGSLYFISSYQINVQLPSSMATGIAKLSVKDTTEEGIQETSPVFLSIKSAKPNYVQYAKNQAGIQVSYLAALHNSNGSLVTAEDPAKSGEAIQLYAVGLGETSPSVPAGELAIAPITGKVEIIVNGVSAQVLWAGLQGQYAGLYQINFIVPDGVTAKDITITVTQTDGTVQTDTFLLESL